MSREHDVVIVRLGPVRKHPNADALEITEVHGCSVITRPGDFHEGDLAVYLPIDTVVPDVPRWGFLQGHLRIRAKRLRGIFSMGLLAAVDPAWMEGQEVSAEMGTKTYEPPADLSTGGDNEPDPGFMPVYTDIESLRRWDVDVMTDPNEEVTCTEKTHGCNGRFCWSRDRLWCGSRTGIKREDLRSIWWRAAQWADLANVLKGAPNIVFYGEVYGQVQDLKYGVPNGVVRLVFFDAFDIATHTYLNFDKFRALAEDRLGLMCAPALYRGPYSGLDRGLAEGPSVVGAGACIREGFVMRPVRERFHESLGRVILGEGYHLRKSG